MSPGLTTDDDHRTSRTGPDEPRRATDDPRMVKDEPRMLEVAISPRLAQTTPGGAGRIKHVNPSGPEAGPTKDIGALHLYIKFVNSQVIA